MMKLKWWQFLVIALSFFCIAISQADSPVISKNGYVSLDFSSKVSRGTVGFVIPQQPNATGPQKMVWSGAHKHSVVTVLTTNQSTIKLRAKRKTGACGSFRMNDAVLCQTGPKSVLEFQFNKQDNPDLPTGYYYGGFVVKALGWHDKSYSEDISFVVQINLREVVSEKGYVSSDFSSKVSKGTVGFVIPQQPNATGPQKMVWSGAKKPSIVTVSTQNQSTGKTHELKLKVKRKTGGCGSFQMNDAVLCQSGPKSVLKLQFDKQDNPDLPTGIYTGSFTMRAQGWHDKCYSEDIFFSVNINTK